MDMDRRTVLKGTGGIVAASALAGCLGDDDGPEGDMAIWHELGEGELEVFNDMVEEFEDETDHDVAVSEVADLEDRVETAVAAGEGPEMWSWAHDWVGNHWDRGFLADASDDLTITLEDEFTPAAVEAVQPPGTDAVVGLPAAGETISMFYNPDLIDEPPETLEEVLDIAEEFHDPQAGEYGFSQDVNVYTFSWALQAFGSRIFEVDEDGEAHLGLEDDEMHEGMEIVRDLYEYMPRDLEYDAQVSPFTGGDVPIHMNGPWAVSDFNDEDATFEVAELPAIDGGEAAPYTGIDVWYFSDMINEDEDRKDVTIEFGEYYTTNEEFQQRWADEQFYIPVIQDIDEDGLPDEVAAFQSAFAQGVAMPVDARMNQVWEPFEDAISAVLTDDGDIAEEFASAADSIRDSWDDE